ncbi:MAG: aminotransferase class I/II-fold pyridoxal phosphate-dependent enzyme [Planctomycetota bacterium]
MIKHRIGSTECVHAGTGPVPIWGSVSVPIVHSAPFHFKNTKDLVRYMKGHSRREQPEYGRMGNPTVAAVEKRLASLEGAEAAQLFASGMAAVTTLFLAYLKSGDHIVMTSDIYKRTRRFAVESLSRFGIRATLVKPDLAAIAKAVGPRTRMIFTETPTNPFLNILDMRDLARLGRRKKILTVVDSTFATPVNLRPLEHGVDLVTHSCTKYLGGHNDLVAGVLAGKKRHLEPVSELLSTLGGISDPTTAFLLDRGLKTLFLRVARQNQNAQTVAEFLENQPRIRQVWYPGLASHPHHDTARRTMAGFGGVVTFTLNTDAAGTGRFVDALRIPHLAPSLGGVDSLVEQVVTMSYFEVSAADRKKAGVSDNLIRFSLGIEDIEDLLEDLRRGLRKI